MVRAKEAVVFDGNGPVRKVTTSSPSYIRLDVHVTGRAAHAGVEPEKGISAIKIAAEIIAGLPQGRLGPGDHHQHRHHLRRQRPQHCA